MSNRRHKSFKAEESPEDFAPLDFDLNEENFVCKPAIQGDLLLEFVAKADGDSGGAAASALYEFFEAAMEEPEYERFRKHLRTSPKIIKMDLIGEIAGWLVEEYTARPTQPPVSSVGGRKSSGPSSTAVAS